MSKPFSQACLNNRDPILQVLRGLLMAPGLVLELGSGTGQHAVHFAAHLPHVSWQPTDLAENLSGIRAWCDEADLTNLRPPIVLDVTAWPWPIRHAAAVFSANTAHILHWAAVEAMFRGVGAILRAGGVFVLYGPSHYGGVPTSESNARFDEMLRRRDPGSGVRDFEAVDTLARSYGLCLTADHAMPANNRTLVWHKPDAKEDVR